MRLLALLVVCALAPACRGSGEPRDEGSVRLISSGFRVGERQVGAAAVLRNDGAETRTAIKLHVTFLADGDEVGAERDVLPFCPARTECPWGQTLYGEHLGTRWRSIDRVTVEVAGHRSGSGRGEISKLNVTTDEDAVTIRRPGVDGTAYLVAYDDGAPRAGISFHTEAGERGPLRYSQRLFERDAADRVRAFVYPGAIPEGVRGPAD